MTGMAHLKMLAIVIFLLRQMSMSSGQAVSIVDLSHIANFF